MLSRRSMLGLSFAFALVSAMASPRKDSRSSRRTFRPRSSRRAARRSTTRSAPTPSRSCRERPSPPGYTRFRQANDFYYLCGIEVPHAYLLLDGSAKKATLFLPPRNEGRERGEGKMLSAEDAEEVKKLSGVDAVASTEVLRRGDREPVPAARAPRPLHAARPGRARLDEPRPRRCASRPTRPRIPSTGGPRGRAASSPSSRSASRSSRSTTSPPRSTRCA